MMESIEVQVFEKYMQNQEGYIIYNTYMTRYMKLSVERYGYHDSFGMCLNKEETPRMHKSSTSEVI
jgi:hypothetical protein